MLTPVNDIETLTGGAEADPAAALRRIAELRRELQRNEEALVHRARVAGLSWADIAAALGVSKQAVHKKYVGRRWPRGGDG
jgi:DNA-directed RNA polymerase specialized sigma24 family protein